MIKIFIYPEPFIPELNFEIVPSSNVKPAPAQQEQDNTKLELSDLTTSSSENWFNKATQPSKVF